MLTTQEIARLLAGRQAVEYYREHQGRADATEHERLVQELIAKLKELGFESIDAFFSFNGNACKQEVEACYILFGTCDGCVDRKRGCFDKCYVQRTTEVRLKRVQWCITDFFDWQRFEGNSPPYCSMYFSKKMEARFDVFWNMPCGIDPQKYEQARK